jgi:16S rRNA (guanine966-N2)-methyltransferase
VSLRLSGGRKLQSPPGQTARPTTSRVRLAVMNLLAADLPGARWLDLCCGSGVMGCEALQRGAAAVVAVDHDRRMAATARANLEAVQRGLDRPAQVRVLCGELPRWLELPPNQHWRSGPVREPCREPGSRVDAPGFDLIYVDPPYAAGLHGSIATAVRAGEWLAPEGRMLWECASGNWPKVPAGWCLKDQRCYGSSGLMILGR